MGSTAPPPFEALPTYSEASTNRRSLQQSPTLARDPVAHCYRLTDKSGHAWITLKCTSRSHSPEQLPWIVEGERLSGVVEMDLTDGMSIKSVRVSVTGELLAEANIRFSFLELSQELWSHEVGTSSSTASIRSTTGKLRGSFSWPFSFELPHTVPIQHEGALSEFRLPATFFSRNTRCTVLYRLTVTVVHARFTPDHSLGTNLAYLPLITPDPLSIARQLAYQEHSPLIGIDGDPDGWHSLPPFSVSGVVFGVRSADVKCTLSLAKPLCYTRGSVVPIHFTLEGTDPQALDVLTAPNVFTIHLRRIIIFGYQQGGPAFYESKQALAGKKLITSPTRHTEILSIANWWKSSYGEDRPSDTRRTVQAEVHLPSNLHPPAHLARYELMYDLAIYVPSAVAFVPATSPNTEPLQTVPIEIATAYAPGPRPFAYTPPRYGPSDEAQMSARITTKQGFL